MKKMVILNITHGDNVFCTKKHFLPVAAGACRNDIANDACGEDNISFKNKYYGDFTSLYWAWKNLKNVDIIGTSHYRRYISDRKCLSEVQYNVTWNSFDKYYYNTSLYRNLLKKYDFIMVKPLTIFKTIEEHYIECHPYPENLKIVEDVLNEIAPTYVESWNKYLNSKQIQFGFLFITKWKHFDNLCSWLYPILSAIEQRIDLKQYEGYQSRVIAYLYERLVPVYLYNNNLEIYHMSMFFIDSETGTNIWDVIKNKWYDNYRTQIRRPVVKAIKGLLRI